MNSIHSAVLLVLLALSMTGCVNLPENLVRKAKVASLRSETVPLDRVPALTTFHAELMPGVNFAQYERLFFKTVIVPGPPGYVDRATGRTEYSTPNLRPGTAGDFDGTVLAALSRRGFPSVSRIVSGYLEIPTDAGKRPTGNLLGGDSRRTLLLLVTVQAPKVLPRMYKWRTFVLTEHYEKLIGSDVTALVTAQILDAETAETLWSGSASVQAFVANQPTPDDIATALVRGLSERLPNFATPNPLNANSNPAPKL